jgi:hypothetical protein
MPCRNNALVLVPVPARAAVLVLVLVLVLAMAPCECWRQLRGTSSACRTCCSVSGRWSRRTRSTNAGCSRWGRPGVPVVCALPVTPRAVPFMMLCLHVCFLLLPGGCLLFCFLLSPFVLIDRKLWGPVRLMQSTAARGTRTWTSLTSKCSSWRLPAGDAALISPARVTALALMQDPGRAFVSSIVYGSTKGFVSYGGFTHVGFPLRRFPLPHFIRLVSNHHTPLSLPLPSRRSRVPDSAVVLCQLTSRAPHCTLPPPHTHTPPTLAQLGSTARPTQLPPLLPAGHVCGRPAATGRLPHRRLPVRGRVPAGAVRWWWHYPGCPQSCGESLVFTGTVRVGQYWVSCACVPGVPSLASTTGNCVALLVVCLPATSAYVCFARAQDAP